MHLFYFNYKKQQYKIRVAPIGAKVHVVCGSVFQVSGEEHSGLTSQTKFFPLKPQFNVTEQIGGRPTDLNKNFQEHITALPIQIVFYTISLRKYTVNKRT